MSKLRPLSLWAPVVAYMMLIFFVSEQSTLPGVELAWDKLIHAVAYGVLGVLAIRAFHGGLDDLRWKPSLAGVALAGGYGATDEIHQLFVPGRNASVGDLAADVAGVLLSLALLGVLLRFRVQGRPVRRAPR